MAKARQVAHILVFAAGSLLACNRNSDGPAEPTFTIVNGIPSDFKIVARYSAGYSPWKSWEVTISADGTVSQRIIQGGPDFKDVVKSLTLSQKDLANLLTRIEQAKWVDLAGGYSYPVTCNPTLLLDITMYGKSYCTEVYAPSHTKEHAEVRLFLSVWSEILRKVPAPNPKQTPDMYQG